MEHKSAVFLEVNPRFDPISLFEGQLTKISSCPRMVLGRWRKGILLYFGKILRTQFRGARLAGARKKPESKTQ
jgi:hypothetical protein